MRFFFTVLPLLLMSSAVARTFVDDRGVTHEINGKPTIVTYSHTAVTLSHFGLGPDQLVGVYGEYAFDGSDFNFNQMSEESTYPADPNPEEMELVTSVPHISPSCQKGYCQEFDVEIFASVKPDYLVMHGYRGELWGFNATIEKQVVNIIGKPIIYIDVAQQGANCIGEEAADECYGKSMIQVIEQYDALALALGIPRPPGSVEQDKRDMCKAAQTFQEAAEVAQSKGVRAMAGYITPTPGAMSYLAYPSDDMVLRMFEELGMPILHPGSCTAVNCTQNYFWEWIPTDALFPNCAEGQSYAECSDSPLYPVDFWLYDHRTTLDFTSNEFKTAFPDKAVVKGQHAYWPIGGGIISYRHAAEILSILAPRLAAAERIHPATSCTPADVSSIDHAQDGLAPSQFACYDESVHRQEYFQCPASNGKSLSGGAISGIVIAGVVFVVAVAFFVMGRRSTGKEAM